MDTKTFLKNYAEQAEKQMLEEKIKAGNKLMNWLTDYYLEQKEFYKEEYGENWYEAMRVDNAWIPQTDDDEFWKLIKEYYETVI